MKLIKIVMLCLLLNACFGTSKQAKFYTQFASSAEVISADYTALIGVNRVQLPKYMDRPQIVTHQKDSAQINISEYNRWVESPSVLATRAIVEDMGVLLPACQVKMNQAKGEDFDKTVLVEITKITTVLGDQTEMVAWYTIKDKSGKTVVHQKFTDIVLLGKTYDDLAQGYSQLLAHLSQEIARALIKK